MGRCKNMDSLKPFLHALSYLGPVSCVFTSWISSGLTIGSGCSLMAARWQIFFVSFLSSFRAHQLTLRGGCNWRRWWYPTPVLLPGKSHGRRSLVGCSPWGREESDTTEWLHFHFSLSCIGEGNGNPLQCSCLENPRDGGAWSAAIYGVAQSRTRLKRLSSSSSMHISSLDYLQYIIQCKCHVNTCKYNVNAMKIVAGLQQIQVLLFGTF